ncbi:carboxypeptidase-like regulatory domain-containing protein [Hymenobacter sp. HSC-4F20]|uniref:carboxypeptidase-like regulatory domain-containing protein n=1 Tax=Hymenobacter sp. HSC-4F20 TaxID=2864135 RepID=UPI001C72A356|nr:carboxypeptidase-like regulatory domain-containing protein [Hymenobacter sp. HSC-4F20]MBX0290582.1 carboxypeptidase-like regulatory domain-containing protein [Hymenobacter sp. HSC-4F20]
MHTALLTLLIAMWLGGGVRVQAQVTMSIHGRVTDSLQAPLPGVSVYITTQKSLVGLVYVATDQDGTYSCAFPARPGDTVNVHLRMIGFKPVVQAVAVPAQANLRYNFVLLPYSTLINEVIIHGTRPRIAFNDTTTFQAKDFTAGTPTTLEGVLRNVPGFLVSPEGIITYKGTTISGIYIEGENLTGSNYQRIAHNLDATLVDKIQPIEHFVENKLLGGLVRSETTVLNITIPEDRKNNLFGNASLEVGLTGRRNLAANVFSYRPKNKLYFIGASNNIGLNQDPVAASLTNPSGVGLKASVRTLHPLLPDPVLVSSTFRPDLSNLNNEHTGGLINVFKPSVRCKILTDISYYSNTTQQQLENLTRYLLAPLDSSFLRLQENTQLKKQLRSAHMRNNLFAVLGEKSNLTYENRLDITRSRTSSQLELETQTAQQSISEIILQGYRNTPVRFGQNLLVTKRLNATAALQGQLLHTYDEVGANLGVSSTLPARFAELVADSLSNQADQRTVVKQTAISGELEYFKTAPAINYSAVVGFDYSYAALATLFAGSGEEPLSRMQENRISLSQNRAYAKLKLDKTFHKFSTTGEIALVQASNQANGLGVRTQYSTFPTLSLIARYRFDIKSLLGLSYSLERSFSNAHNLLPQEVLTDYRSFYRGLPAVVEQEKHTLNATYTYVDNLTLSELQASVAVGLARNSFGQASEVSEYTTTTAWFVAPDTRNASFQVKASKFIKSLSLRAQMESTNTYVESYSYLGNSSLRFNRFLMYKNSVKLGTAFSGPVNVYVGGSFIHNTLLVQSIEQELRVSNSRWQADYQLVFQRQKLYISLQADQLLIYNNHYTFFGGTARYSPAKGKLVYFLTMKNLLNTKSFKQFSITDLVYSQTSYAIMPRVTMLGASYRF